MLQHFNRASSQCRSLSLMSSLQPLSMIASVEETPRATELDWTREQLRDRKYRLKVKYMSSQGEHVLGHVHTYTDILKITHSMFRYPISTHGTGVFVTWSQMVMSQPWRCFNVMLNSNTTLLSVYTQNNLLFSTTLPRDKRTYYRRSNKVKRKHWKEQKN